MTEDERAMCTAGRREEVDDAHAVTTNAGETPYTIVDLANMSDRALVDEVFLAKAFSVTTRTIRRMVERCELPPPVSLGNRSLWMVGRVLAYIEERAQAAEQLERARSEKIRRLEQ